MPGAEPKECSVCGQDCSRKARTKNKVGKYVCKDCLDHAAAAKAAAERAKHKAANSAAALAAPDPNQPNDNSLILGIGTPPDAPHCPLCGVALKAEAVLCIACGYDVEKGERVKQKIKKR